jgi:hypothetical protein
MNALGTRLACGPAPPLQAYPAKWDSVKTIRRENQKFSDDPVVKKITSRALGGLPHTRICSNCFDYAVCDL